MTIKVNTRGMFFDLLTEEDRKLFKPEFTIQEYDVTKGKKTYKSLYKLYMSSVDEYDFAETHLGSYAIWQQLLSTKWFTVGYRCHRGIEAWREDLRARDESRAKKVLMLAASEGDVSAAKKLLDISKRNTPTKRGRFVKDEAKKEAVKMAEDQEFLTGAASRLSNVINIMD